MSETAERQILTPGAPAPVAAAPATAAAPAPDRKRPGPKPKAEREAAAATGNAQTAGDGEGPVDGDLEGFDSDTLPARGPAAFTPEQMVLVQQMITAAVGAAKSSQDPGTALRLTAAGQRKLPTQDAAIAMQADAVARGQRPRAILSEEGWVTHMEMTRRPDSLNGQAIAAATPPATK